MKIKPLILTIFKCINKCVLFKVMLRDWVFFFFSPELISSLGLTTFTLGVYIYIYIKHIYKRDKDERGKKRQRLLLVPI